MGNTTSLIIYIDRPEFDEGRSTRLFEPKSTNNLELYI